MRPSSCLLASVLVAGFLAVGARPAAATSCLLGNQSPCEAFARSSIVFVGEPVSVKKVGDECRMRLRVVRALKGIETATADVWSKETSSCDIGPRADAARTEAGRRAQGVPARCIC